MCVCLKADLHANIDYLAPHGAPDNDRKAKESSWLVSQAFIEGLRYYPSGQQASMRAPRNLPSSNLCPRCGTQMHMCCYLLVQSLLCGVFFLRRR